MFDCDDEDDGQEDDVVEEDWREGQCDNCTGSSPEEIEAARVSTVFTVFSTVCACAIGQGADDSANCTCGPG